MSTSTLTPSFRQVVADVAARAKTILPSSINGRLEGAIKLVLGRDVEPQADGSILVGSCTDPLKTYRLVGTACECKDFVDGRAPQGWCRHRIAAGIHKRCQQEMAPRSTPVESEPEIELPADFETWGDNDIEEPLPEAPAPPPAAVPLPEARSSANVRLQVCGYEAQITLRDHDEAALMVRLTALIQGYGQPPPPPVEPTAQCPQHGAMKPSTKGQGWYCPHKTAEGQWCKGR